MNIQEKITNKQKQIETVKQKIQQDKSRLNQFKKELEMLQYEEVKEFVTETNLPLEEIREAVAKFKMENEK